MKYGLHCMGIAENGFRELTNSVREVKSVDDMKNLKVRVAGSNLLMECYKRWGADATNLNWSETYTALQQNTVEGEENPLPAIDAASVQEVQPYCSMWDAIYDCLFFCINQDIYDGLTPEQQAVVDKAGRMAVEYERYINAPVSMRYNGTAGKRKMALPLPQKRIWILIPLKRR